MRIDDELDVNPSAPVAMNDAKISTDQGADAVTARKVNTTLREMFDQTLSRKNAQVELNESVIKYLALMGKMATDKRGEMEKEKRTHKKTYERSSQLIREIAADRFTSAALASPFALLTLSPNRLDQLAGEKLSQSIVPALSGMWTSGKEAEKAKVDAVGGLAMQELNNLTSQNQLEGNNREQIVQNITKPDDALVAAARGNG